LMIPNQDANNMDVDEQSKSKDVGISVIVFQRLARKFDSLGAEATAGEFISCCK
jgi:hypothetical protein